MEDIHYKHDARNNHALINVKPRGGSGYPRGFDCEVCPQGGDFDRKTYPQGEEFDMTIILAKEEGLLINL